jgi:hypothetical protein
METLVNSINAYIRTFSFDNPSSYLVIGLIFLAILSKWKILVLVLLTCIFANVAGDLMVMNLQNANIIITVPMVIYCVGGFLIAFTLLIGFVKFMLE